MHHHRHGLCETCREPVPAQQVFRDGKVFLSKQCPQCGTSESLVSNDLQAWQAKRDIWHYRPQDEQSCGLRCADCRISHSPTVVFVDVTNHCNMNCPICIANIRGMGFTFNPPKDYFERIFRQVAQFEPRPMIEMFGGEPTVRKDILDLVKLARHYGLKSRLVTNGLRLADEEYCRHLCEEGVRFVFALDGIRPEIYARLRKSTNACETKLKALANIEKYSRRKHTLLCCAARGVNDQHMGELLQFIHDRTKKVDTLGLIPLTENWEPGEFEANLATTREDAERMLQDCLPGERVEFVPAGITYYLARARAFFRPKSTSEHLILGGVHPDCETISMLVSDGQRFRGADHYLRVPFAQLARELMQICLALDAKLSRLDRDKLGQRLRGQCLVIKALAPLALRAVDFKKMFKGHLLLNPLRILLGRLMGRRGRDLAYRHMDFPRFLRLVIFPFEEYHTLDSAKLHNCRAVFAYEEVHTGAIKTIPACAWNTYRNEILRKVAEHYAQPAESAEPAAT